MGRLTGGLVGLPLAVGTHTDNLEGTPRQAAVLDQAMIAQLADLQAKGLLDQTLVVLGTEFGRAPRINGDDGRDHDEEVAACQLSGAEIKSGQAYRTPTATTSRGRHVGGLSRLADPGYWTRRWWSWPPSSAALCGSTATTGGIITMRRLRACLPGLGFGALAWDTQSDNFEGTPLSSCFQARVESPGNYIGGTTGVFILQRRPLPPKSRGPSPV